jgi:DegV family protein with EDD domain
MNSLADKRVSGSRKPGVVTESTADIPEEMVTALDITVVPSYVVFGNDSYRDGVDLTKEQFYTKLSESRDLPTTATPPPSVYGEAYRRLAEETDEIVSIHLASNLSGLYNAASLAAENMSQIRVAVVDSQQVTMGYGWMAVAAAQAAQRGESMEQILELVESMKGRTLVLAVLDTMEYIYRGGRVNWVQAMLGSLMQIKLIVEVRYGQVRLLERTRTWDRALNRLLDFVQALGHLERAIVLHANAPDRAENLADRLQAIVPDWSRLIGQAGVTIASHTGPGAVGIACVTAGQISFEAQQTSEA